MVYGYVWVRKSIFRWIWKRENNNNNNNEMSAQWSPLDVLWFEHVENRLPYKGSNKEADGRK